MTLDLGQKTLRVGFNNDLPYTEIEQDETGKTTGVEGIEARMVQLMARHFNFTIDFVNCHKQYGVLLPNGSWSGMMGRLNMGHLDLGIGGISMTFDRIRVVDWLAPYWIDQFTYAVGVAKNAQPGFDLLHRPLSEAVWMAILVSFGLLLAFARLQQRFQPKSWHRDALWLSVATLLRQPHPLLRTLPLSSKLMTVVWMTMSSVVLLNIYAANLCSLLAVPSSSPLDTLDKLAEACSQGQIIPLASSNTSILPALARSQKPAIRTILPRIEQCQNHVHGVQLIVQHGPRYAFISSRERLAVSALIHAFYMPPEDSLQSSFFPMFTSIPIRNQLAPLLRKPFQTFVTRIVNAGLVARWKRNILLAVFRRQQQQVADQSAPHGIDHGFNLHHLSAVFFLYLSMIGISILVFLFELWLVSSIGLKN